MVAYGVDRFGAAHTAGSDALATLELYLRVSSAPVAVAKEAAANPEPLVAARTVLRIGEEAEPLIPAPQPHGEGARASAKLGKTGNETQTTSENPLGKNDGSSSGPADRGGGSAAGDAAGASTSVERQSRLHYVRFVAAISFAGLCHLAMLFAYLAGLAQLLSRWATWRRGFRRAARSVYPALLSLQELVEEFPASGARACVDALKMATPESLWLALSTFSILVFSCCYLLL
jgi:hypothetical protein